MDLALIDGPNVFNSMARHFEEHVDKTLQVHLVEYFLTWFDFDRLVLKALGHQSPPGLGIVIFHSSKGLGRGGALRLEGDAARTFWTRQGGNLDTSDVIVDVPTDQREHYEFECSNCKHKNHAKVSGEKGVDSAMIVHMFETAGRWESLALFSRDVDFAPVVWALRRRGKQVYVVSEPDDAPTALGRSAQSVFALPLDALLADFGLFLFCRRGGVIDQWRANAEANRRNSSGYFWGAGDLLSILMKGDSATGHIRTLRDHAAALPGFLFRGPTSEAPRFGAFAAVIPLPFRCLPPLGDWAEAIVEDATLIKDPGENDPIDDDSEPTH